MSVPPDLTPSHRMEVLAGVRVGRDAHGIRLTPPRSFRWLGAALVATLLGLAGWLTSSYEDGLIAFMAADFVLWMWAVGTTEWRPTHRLRRMLEVRETIMEGYRGAVAREVVVDGCPVPLDRVRGGALVRSAGRRGSEWFAVYLVAAGAIVCVAESQDANQAGALTRMLHTELGGAGEPIVSANRPAPGAVGCVGITAIAIVLLAAYLSIAGGIDLYPALRVEIAFGGAALHGVLGLGLRRALEAACAPATKRSIHSIFGVEG